MRAVLSSGTVRLPKKLRQVAIFVWQHPTIVALGTVTSVASQAGVQPSTLVRFAQTFGYSGFSDLQNVFKAHLADGGRGWRNPRAATTPAFGEATLLVDGFVNSSMASLAGVRDRLEISNFEDVARTLACGQPHLRHRLEARLLPRELRVARRSPISASATSRSTTSARPRSNFCAARRLPTRCSAISFTPYNSITPELAASAAQRGVPIVSLTDSAFSPLAPISKTYLEVVEEEFSGFKSLSATLAVAMALVLRVAQLRVPPAEAAEPSQTD